MKLIKVFNLSSLVQNSTYYALAPDLSCRMTPRVDRAAVLHQRSTMAELSCVHVCTAPVMWCYTCHISSCIPVCLQGMSPPSCLSSGFHPALCRHCHQKGAVKTHEVSGRLKKQGQELSSTRQCEVKLLPINNLGSWIPTVALSVGILQSTADGQVCLSLHSRLFCSVPRHNCDKEGKDLQHEPKVRSEE